MSGDYISDKPALGDPEDIAAREARQGQPIEVQLSAAETEVLRAEEGHMQAAMRSGKMAIMQGEDEDTNEDTNGESDESLPKESDPPKKRKKRPNGGNDSLFLAARTEMLRHRKTKQPNKEDDPIRRARKRRG